MTSRGPVVSRRCSANRRHRPRRDRHRAGRRRSGRTGDQLGSARSDAARHRRARRTARRPRRGDAYPETTHLLRWSGVTKRRLGITPPTTQLQVPGTASRCCTVDFPRFLGSTGSVDRRTLGGAQSTPAELGPERQRVPGPGGRLGAVPPAHTFPWVSNNDDCKHANDDDETGGRASRVGRTSRCR